MANNNYPQITSVTSEALQSQIRNLLPSQEGFGTDLMAQNVIVPIIDLTSAAEGSSVGQNLQTALAFGSQTAFDASNAIVVIANTAGFWRITGTLETEGGSGGPRQVLLRMSDGLSTKDVFGLGNATSGASTGLAIDFDLTVFLRSGDSISCVAGNLTRGIGSARQIADVNGQLINPSGFTPQ